MSTQMALVVTSIVASVMLGTLSNWFYDLLREAGFLPSGPRLRVVLVVVLASIPLILLAASPSMSPIGLSHLGAWLRTPMPLWALAVAMMLSLLFGLALGKARARGTERELQKCQSLLEEASTGSSGPTESSSRSRYVRPPR